MSYDFVFVHGTGVREPAYTAAFNRISKQLTTRRPGVRVHRCYWGADYGTRLGKGGASIPGFETKRDAMREPDDAEYTLYLWSLLYQDPLFEIRLLGLKDASSGFTPGERPLAALDQSLRALVPSDALLAHLREANLAHVLDAARDTIIAETDYQEMIERGQDPVDEYRTALCRALVAQCVVLAKAHDETEGSVFLDASVREALVEDLIAALGGRDRGVFGWVQTNLIGVVKRVATNRIDRRRGILSEEGGGAAGDVLMYQARGEGIRKFIRASIAELPGPIVVIAHSLGGIASVDLFIQSPDLKSKVRLLVTVGSQAPVLYELNALVSLAFDPKADLPEHFPRWLNIYDEHDFLSYKASKIFPGAEDEQVYNGQPFPESHSGYWNNGEVWDHILSRLP